MATKQKYRTKLRLRSP